MLSFRYAVGLLNLDEDHILKVLKWTNDRISTLSDLVTTDMAFVWLLPTVVRVDKNDFRCLKAFKVTFEINLEMKVEDISSLCRKFCQENRIHFGPFMKMMRNVLTGLQVYKLWLIFLYFCCIESVN